MKTILLVITKAELGGAQQFVLTLAKGLQEAGWKVLVGCGSSGFLEEELKKTTIPFFIFKHLGRSHNPGKSLFFIYELYSYIKKNKVDIVHLNSSNTLVGGLSAKLAHIKSIATIHGLSFADPHHTTSPVKQFLYRELFKLLLSCIDQIIFVSKYNQSYAEKIGLTKRGMTIYNGIDTDQKKFISFEEARRYLELKIGISLHDHFIIGSIGRYAYPKNYEFLIEHFVEIKKIIPQAKLVLIGEGPDRTKYEELIKKYQLQSDVFLTGEIREGVRYLKAFNLFILPSLYEGLPIVLLEALRAHIPIIASPVGGIPELLPTSQLFSPKTPESFLEKLSQIPQPLPFPTLYSQELMIRNYLEEYTRLSN